jgi:hypothetical protein
VGLGYPLAVEIRRGTWGDFEAGAADLAARARAVLYRSGAGEGMLATLRGDRLPRVHPVNVGVVDGRLLVFVQDHSAKTRDLIEDGRYALHGMQDREVPHEFLVRGRAHLVTDPALRDAALAVWPFRPGKDYPLFELEIEHALFRARSSANDWAEQYTSWRPD